MTRGPIGSPEGQTPRCTSSATNQNVLQQDGSVVSRPSTTPLSDLHRMTLLRRTGSLQNPYQRNLERVSSSLPPFQNVARDALQQQSGSLRNVARDALQQQSGSLRNVARDAFLRQRGSLQNVSQQGASLQSVLQNGATRHGASFQNVSQRAASPPSVPRRVPLQQQSSSLQNFSQQGASIPSVWKRGAVRRGTSRQGRRISGPTSRLRLDSKEHVKTLNKEFKFAVDCLKVLLRAYSPKWHAIISAPLADRSRDRLCTQHIKRAILHVVSKELADGIYAAFDFTHEATTHNHVHFRTLLQLLTTKFCNIPYSTRKFLEFCCEVAEVSALMYIMGYRLAPSYGVMCIFYATKNSMETNSFGDDFDAWLELDDLARRVNENYPLFDPATAMLRHRRKVLSKFNIVLEASSI